jgi:hypothetical protein
VGPEEEVALQEYVPPPRVVAAKVFVKPEDPDEELADRLHEEERQLHAKHRAAVHQDVGDAGFQ